MRQWALLASLAVACANHGSSDRGLVTNRPYAKAPLPESVSEGVRTCFENPATQEYLAQLHRQLMESWSVPHGTRAYDVGASVTLEESGVVAAFRVDKEASTAQADAIAEAVRTAQPFPPLTGAATCLSRLSILMQFRTPSQE